MRTGSVYIHEGGSSPNTNSKELSNVSGQPYWENQKIWHAGNDGAGSGLDADTLDGIQASSFLRSDTSDSFSGQLTFTGTNDQKILLQGASNPYIRFQEGTSNKAYIQWHSNGNLYFVNQESAEHLRIGSGANGLVYNEGGSDRTVWHAGNDGSGSGLDADTLDGLQASSFLSSSSTSFEVPSDLQFTVDGGSQLMRLHYGQYSRALVVGPTIRDNYTSNSTTVSFVVEGRADLDGCEIHGGRNYGLPAWNRITAVGSGAMTYSTLTGTDNTACGAYALRDMLDGTYNTAIGTYAGSDEKYGDYNVFLGSGTAQHADDETYRNVYIGYQAGYDNNFDDCVMIGYRSGYSQDYTEGNKNTYVGSHTAYSKRRGENNTLIGYQAGRYKQNGSSDSSSSTYYSNTTCLGYDSRISGSNQVQLGNSSTTTYAYGSIQNRSDARDKTDIRPTILGLDFIKKLKPVDFRWDYRDDYTKLIEREETKPVPDMIPNPDFVPGGKEPEEIKAFKDNTEIIEELVPIEKDGSKARTRFHHGLIAQDVKEIMDEMNIDFAGYQDHSIKEGLDVLSIGYQELIAPMIRAIQEQQEQIDTLKEEIKSIKNKE